MYALTDALHMHCATDTKQNNLLILNIINNNNRSLTTSPLATLAHFCASISPAFMVTIFFKTLFYKIYNLNTRIYFITTTVEEKHCDNHILEIMCIIEIRRIQNQKDGWAVFTLQKCYR